MKCITFFCGPFPTMMQFWFFRDSNDILQTFSFFTWNFPLSPSFSVGAKWLVIWTMHMHHSRRQFPKLPKLWIILNKHVTVAPNESSKYRSSLMLSAPSMCTQISSSSSLWVQLFYIKDFGENPKNDIILEHK